MRRQDIQLLASARQGDLAARYEVGRRYLRGTDGFARHVATGLEHLGHASVRERAEAARIVAENLKLDELLHWQQEPALLRAAQAGSAAAQARLGAWVGVGAGRVDDGRRWLEAAARGGHGGAQQALAGAAPAADTQALAWLRALQASGDLDAAAVALFATRRALAQQTLAPAVRALRLALALSAQPGPELDELIAASLALAEQQHEPLRGIAPPSIRAALDALAARGDRDAAYALGRGLCGIACAAWEPAVFADQLNVRKGTAYLLRAADAGRDEAWLHLYQLHANHRLSVANPQMARFFLEKAAARGQATAQRKLGALLLREAATLAESEQAIHWLHQASSQGDRPALALLRSLVLPVGGRDEDASSAIAQLRASDPWLASRLELARDFGLTRLEALCVDPAQGLRPWGLVVGKNPFIVQSRLSAPRAVPATTPAALSAARRAASLFGQAGRDVQAAEGDLRRRSMRQRRAFERHRLDDTMFFAAATSTTLEALRFGPKWAFRAKQTLRHALGGA